MNQKYITTAAYYAAFILLGVTVAADGPALLKLAEHTSSSLKQISLLFLISALGYLLGSFFGGRIYDRVSGHRFMGAMLVSIGIFSALVPVANALWVLLVIRSEEHTSELQSP